MEAAARLSSPPAPAAAANENATPLRLVVAIMDPEVAHELSLRDGEERDTFVRHALRIGVLALRQASGALDAHAIQREGERMLAAVREVLGTHATQTSTSLAQLLAGYLDPKGGSLPQRLDRLTKRDGEIEALLSKHLDGDRSTIAQSLARHVGQESALFKLLSPKQADGLLATLTQAVDVALRTQRDEVLRQFSLDRPDSALSRLVGDVTHANGKLRGDLAADIAGVTAALSLENDGGPMARFVARVEKAQRAVLEQFSFDCEGSAICRLTATMDDTRATVKRSLTLDDPASPLSLLRQELTSAVATFAESNARFQSDVRATLETFQVRRKEAARSSTHGHSFEYAAGDVLQLEAQAAGDVCSRLSGTPGREGRKVGDYVLTLGPESAAPGARIVCECKADKGYTEAKALEEIALARKNREAQIGVFIVARESATEGFAGLRRVGSDILVVWDAEDPASDLNLRAALSIARALVVREHADSVRAEGDVREIEESATVIERMVVAVESIAHDARNIVKKGVKIGKAAEGVRERLGGEVERLRGMVASSGGDMKNTEHARNNETAFLIR